MKRHLGAFLMIALLSLRTPAQEPLTLQQCVENAFSKNIDIQKLQNTLRISQESLLQSKLTYAPTVNAGWNFTNSFGTTFDMNTFRRVSAVTQQSSPNLSVNLTVFQGLNNYYSVKKAESDLQANYYLIEKTRNELATTIALLYLQVIFDQENMKISDRRLELLNQQLDRTLKQVDAGVKVQSDVLNIRTQVANENLTRINLKNQYEKDKLNLLQTVEMDPNGSYSFTAPALDRQLLDTPMPEYATVYGYAIQNFPEIKEQQARIESGRYAWKANRSLLYPTLSVSGTVTSRYSSNGIPDPNNPFQVIDAGYLEQMKQNRNGFVGVNLSVPIFNQKQAATNVNISRIQMENAEIEMERQQNLLTKKVQQAYLDVTSARAKYEAVSLQLQTIRETHAIASTRLDKGLMDFYAFMEILNNKSAAEIEQLNAGYDFLMKLKILDLYQGKPLKF